jgi:hypothetical protein
MDVSSSSMKVASVTVSAITQGFTEGLAVVTAKGPDDRSVRTAVAKGDPGEYDCDQSVSYCRLIHEI